MGYEDNFLNNLDKKLGNKTIESTEQYIARKEEEKTQRVQSDLARQKREEARAQRITRIKKLKEHSKELTSSLKIDHFKEIFKKEKDEQNSRVIQNLEAREKQFILQNKESINELFEISGDILESSIQPTEYIKQGIYTEAQIQSFLSNTQRLLNIFNDTNTNEQKDIKKVARIFEAIVIDGTNRAECFGKSVIMRPTFFVDDVGSGIDATLSFKDGPFLGVDVTVRDIYSEDFKIKIFKILKNIKENKIPEVKFMQKFNGDITFPQSIPKIVISGDIGLLKGLMYDFKNLTGEKLNEKLRNHTISFKITNQVIEECKIFADFAENIGQLDIALSYRNVSSSIEEIRKTLPSLRLLLSEKLPDNVPARIKDLAHEFLFLNKINNKAA